MPAPGNWPITLTEGDPWTKTFTIEQPKGVAKSFGAGTTGSAVIRRHYGDTAAVVATPDVDATDAAAGKITVTLDAAGIAAVDAIDFAALYDASDDQGEIDLGVWALEVTDGGDPEKRRTWAAGPVTYRRTAL